MKIAEVANSVDSDEVAQYEPPHLHLYCLPCSSNNNNKNDFIYRGGSVYTSQYDIAWTKHF